MIPLDKPTVKATHEGFLLTLLDNLKTQDLVQQFMSHSPNIAECHKRLDDLRERYAELLTEFIQYTAESVGFVLMPFSQIEAIIPRNSGDVVETVKIPSLQSCATVKDGSVTEIIMRKPTEFPNVVMLAEEKYKEVAP